MAKTERGSILESGIKLTEGSRNDSYGDPNINLQCQKELWDIYTKFNRFSGAEHSLAHDAAIQHICAKLARIACGEPGHRDNYVDLATYAAIAAECDMYQDLEIADE